MNGDLELLRSTLPMRMQDYRPIREPYKWLPKANHTAISASGGIGDNLLCIGPAESVHILTGDVVLYSDYPEILRQFTQLTVRPNSELKPPMDCMITMNHLATFSFAKSFRGFHNEELAKLYLNNRAFASGWEEIESAHPYLDGYLANKAISLGIKRWKMPFISLGLEPKMKRFKFLDSMTDPNRITIHDGHDQANPFNGRSTKNQSTDWWSSFVAGLKRRRPQTEIVQLGTKRSTPIPGAIHTMGLPFKESLRILSSAKIHIDGDSGLVHARAMMQKPSVVMFGPTPPQYFGYDGNINLAPGKCGDCYWVEPTWLQQCPVGFETPKCMDSIDVSYVIEKTRELLEQA